MNRIFSRWLPCITLFAWGSVIVSFYFSGRMQAFLHPTFRPPALAAGLLMLAFGACFLFFPAAAECCSEVALSRTRGKGYAGRIVTFLILLAPISLAAVFSPKGYGESTLLNRGVITDASALNRSAVTMSKTVTRPAPAADNPLEPPMPTKDGSQPPAAAPADPNASTQGDSGDSEYMKKSPDGNIQVQVIDLLYAAQDSSLRGDFQGKKVELVGQFMPDTVNNANGKRFKVVRMFVVCCAADARPVAALVEFDQKTDVPDMTWVKVVGEATFPIENGRPLAILKAEKVTPTDPPEETMLY